jgi:hypothetical protein
MPSYHPGKPLIFYVFLRSCCLSIFYHPDFLFLFNFIFFIIATNDLFSVFSIVNTEKLVCLKIFALLQ